MAREDHNHQWGVNRQPGDLVSSNLCGYGELDQYDERCAACWLGHAHTWIKHDAALERYHQTMLADA